MPVLSSNINPYDKGVLDGHYLRDKVVLPLLLVPMDEGIQALKDSREYLRAAASPHTSRRDRLQQKLKNVLKAPTVLADLPSQELSRLRPARPKALENHSI